MPKNADRFTSPCLSFNLRQAARLMAQEYDRHFRSIDLNGAQYSLMAAIERLEAPSVGALGQALGLEQSTVTRNVDLLARKNYVEAIPASDDHRRKHLRLTPAGRRKMAEAGPIWQAAQKEMTDRLGSKEADELRRLLEKVVSALV